MKQLEEHLSPARCAKRLGVSVQSIRRWIANGELHPVYRPGGKMIIIPASAAERMLKRWQLHG